MTASLIKSAEKTAQHVALESAVKLAWSLEVTLLFSLIIYLYVHYKMVGQKILIFSFIFVLALLFCVDYWCLNEATNYAMNFIDSQHVKVC